MHTLRTLIRRWFFLTIRVYDRMDLHEMSLVSGGGVGLGFTPTRSHTEYVFRWSKQGRQIRRAARHA